MKILAMLLVIILCFTGCVLLSKIAPPQIDERGQPIPGTHQLTPLAQAGADAIPFGGVAASFLLLITNFLEIAKSKKTKKGLIATIRAIEEASQDPAIKDAIAQLKIKLASAHKSADVQPLINELLAKLKFSV